MFFKNTNKLTLINFNESEKLALLFSQEKIKTENSAANPESDLRSTIYYEK